MNKKEQHKQKLKTSRLAIVSMALGIMSCFTLGLLYFGFSFLQLDESFLPVGLFAIVTSGISALFSFILGINAFIKIGRSNKQLKGYGFAIVGIGTASASLFVILVP